MNEALRYLERISSPERITADRQYVENVDGETVEDMMDRVHPAIGVELVDYERNSVKNDTFRVDADHYLDVLKEVYDAEERASSVDTHTVPLASTASAVQDRTYTALFEKGRSRYREGKENGELATMASVVTGSPTAGVITGSALAQHGHAVEGAAALVLGVGTIIPAAVIADAYWSGYRTEQALDESQAAAEEIRKDIGEYEITVPQHAVQSIAADTSQDTVTEYDVNSETAREALEMVDMAEELLDVYQDEQGKRKN